MKILFRGVFCIMVVVFMHSGCADSPQVYTYIHTDTLVVYNFQSKDKVFKLPSKHVLLHEEFTKSSLGTLDKQIVNLPVSPPMDDLIGGAQFSKLKKASSISALDKFPLRTAVKIFFFRNGNRGSCSGQLVGSNLVLTAGHCGVNLQTRNFYDSIHVVSLYDEGKIISPGKKSVVKNAYLFKSFMDRKQFLDLALLELDVHLGSEFGYVGIGFSSESEFYTTNLFHKFSYPATPNPLDPSEVYNGDTLYYNYGFINILSNGNLGLPSAKPHGGPGQSGSGYLYSSHDQHYVVGVQNLFLDHQHVRITDKEFYSLLSVIDDTH